MVLPITGPTRRSLNAGTPGEVGQVSGYQDRYKQSKPYTLPLPYKSRIDRTVKGGGRIPSVSPIENWWTNYTVLHNGGRVAWATPDPADPIFDDMRRRLDLVLNRAREKFMAKANSRVSLSTDILQRKQALTMMIARVQQAGRIFRDLKRLKFREALSELGIKKPAGWRPAVRNAGGLWLEYSYGWKPLVTDIFEAAKVLSGPIYEQWIHEKAGEDWTQTYIEVNASPFDHHTTLSQDVVVRLFARVGAVVSCDNPNLQALKNAGLTNPASWAWELIPFSFVVDWFYDVGGFIESLDDTLGLTVTDGFYTTGWKGSSGVSIKLDKLWPLATPSPYDKSHAWKTRSLSGMDRVRGLPTVKLVRKLKILTNLDRGLNAASLLAQFLPKKR